MAQAAPASLVIVWGRADLTHETRPEKLFQQSFASVGLNTRGSGTSDCSRSMYQLSGVSCRTACALSSRHARVAVIVSCDGHPTQRHSGAVVSPGRQQQQADREKPPSRRPGVRAEMQANEVGRPGCRCLDASPGRDSFTRSASGKGQHLPANCACAGLYAANPEVCPRPTLPAAAFQSFPFLLTHSPIFHLPSSILAHCFPLPSTPSSRSPP